MEYTAHCEKVMFCSCNFNATTVLCSKNAYSKKLQCLLYAKQQFVVHKTTMHSIQYFSSYIHLKAYSTLLHEDKYLHSYKTILSFLDSMQSPDFMQTQKIIFVANWTHFTVSSGCTFPS